MKARQWRLLQGLALTILFTLSYSASAFYDPTIGHWISRDPIEERGGMNLHGIFRNDFVGRYDLFGLCCEVRSAKLEKLGFTYDADGFHWSIVGDINFWDRRNCVPVQWYRGTASINGSPIVRAATDGPLDDNWHVDASPYQGDIINPSTDISHAINGVDILINNDKQLLYLDPPGMTRGPKEGDAFSITLRLKIIVYDISTTPPKKVKESNTILLRAFGTWPGFNYNGP